jgi:hypothetical protein
MTKRFLSALAFAAAALSFSLPLYLQGADSAGVVEEMVVEQEPLTGMEVTLGAGIAVMWVNGDHPVKLPLSQAGAGLFGAQPGAMIKGRVRFDRSSPFRFPFGVEVGFLSGVQRFTFPDATFTFNHSVTTVVPFFGVEYEVLRVNNWAKLYTGVDVRFTIVPTGEYTQRFVRLDGVELPPTGTLDTKPTAFRLGSALRLGVESAFDKDFRVDFNMGYVGMNVLLRDDAHGELLTVDNRYETAERILGHISFTLALLYRL